MISYSDHMFHSAGADERFEKNSFELSNRLHAASASRGDTVHTSGHADYVVRMLVNYPDPEEQLPTSTSCFAIAAGSANIQILTKRGTAHGSVIAEVPYDDDGEWMDEIVRLFEDFRASLDS